MTLVLNGAGEAHAASLISQGKYNTAKSWSFSAADGDALLGKDNDWTTYGQVHLATDDAAANNTKGHWKYPVAKGGEVYREGLIAAKSRATQNNLPQVSAAADRLLKHLDKRDGKVENSLSIDQTATLLSKIAVDSLKSVA